MPDPGVMHGPEPAPASQPRSLLNYFKPSQATASSSTASPLLTSIYDLRLLFSRSMACVTCVPLGPSLDQCPISDSDDVVLKRSDDTRHGVAESRQPRSETAAATTCKRPAITCQHRQWPGPGMAGGVGRWRHSQNLVGNDSASGIATGKARRAGHRT